MESKDKNKLKFIIPIVVIILIISIIIVILIIKKQGNPNDSNISTEKTAEEMLQSAENVYADDITLDIAGNVARAKNYEGKTYALTGHIAEITEDYCLVLAKTVDGDNSKFVHQGASHHKQNYNSAVGFIVYLSSDILADLELCTGIYVIGTIDEVSTREYHAISNQICLYMNDAYFLGTTDY